MNVKTIINKLTLVAMAFLAVSCSQDDATLDPFSENQALKTYTLYLDANAPIFDSVREGETRASGNSWENGDVIYIAFSNRGNTKVSSATYKSSLGAFQFSSASLNAISDASCSVYYFRGGSFSVSGNTVTMDKYTAIFTDTSAKYTCSSNVITMSAAFKPYTWRLCFKGTAGIEVKLKSESNIVYNTSLNLLSGSFSINAGSETLNVRSDAYTPYVYGFFTGSSNTIVIEVGGVSYSRTLASSKLSVGESGFFTIPTSSTLYGWTKETNPVEEHEYVDLGLPSGTLWATCNVGATAPEEYGGYYAWGETEEKDYYDWSSYKHCDGSSSTCHHIGDDIAGTEYDVAHVKWGGSWRMPSLDQIIELIHNCTRTWTQQNGVSGTLVAGPNGRTIFLPATGCFKKESLDYEGSYGFYWSSTLMEYPRVYFAHFLYFDLDRWGWDNITFGREEGKTVRAVCQ